MGEEPKWKYVASIYLKTRHVLVLRDNNLKIQLQVISRISQDGGRSRKLYFIDGESTGYASERDVLAALTLDRSLRTQGIHPLFVECVPGTALHGTQPGEPLARFPSVVEQAKRWLIGFAHRTATAAHGLVAAQHSPLHRTSR